MIVIVAANVHMFSFRLNISVSLCFPVHVQYRVGLAYMDGSFWLFETLTIIHACTFKAVIQIESGIAAFPCPVSGQKWTGILSRPARHRKMLSATLPTEGHRGRLDSISVHSVISCDSVLLCFTYFFFISLFDQKPVRYQRQKI